MFSSGRPRWWHTLHKTGHVVTLAGLTLAGLTLASALAISVPAAAQAKGPALDAEVALGQLPAEAQSTHRLIHSGGPFPYPKDGSVFANRERVLPVQRRGFYHEYTVDTPGFLGRGARRIVCGGARRTQPEGCFYTADHYTTFRRILP